MKIAMQTCINPRIATHVSRLVVGYMASLYLYAVISVSVSGREGEERQRGNESPIASDLLVGRCTALQEAVSCGCLHARCADGVHFWPGILLLLLLPPVLASRPPSLSLQTPPSRGSSGHCRFMPYDAAATTSGRGDCGLAFALSTPCLSEQTGEPRFSLCCDTRLWGETRTRPCGVARTTAAADATVTCTPILQLGEW